jgi:hypothetical protein
MSDITPEAVQPSMAPYRTRMIIIGYLLWNVSSQILLPECGANIQPLETHLNR